VEKLQNSLNRLPFSLVSSPKTDLQVKAAALNFTAVKKIKKNLFREKI